MTERGGKKGVGSLPDSASFLIPRTSKSASLSMSSTISLVNLQSCSWTIRYQPTKFHQQIVTHQIK